MPLTELQTSLTLQFYEALPTEILWYELVHNQRMQMSPDTGFDARTRVHLISQLLMERAYNA